MKNNTTQKPAKSKLERYALLVVYIIAITILICVILAFITNTNVSTEELNRIYLDSENYSDSEIVELDAESYYEKINRGDSFVLIARNETCPVNAPLSTTVEQFQHEKSLKIYSLKADKYKEVGLSEDIPYLPTAIIYENGEIVTYLRADSDEDLDYYKTPEDFEYWLSKYIYLEFSE